MVLASELCGREWRGGRERATVRNQASARATSAARPPHLQVLDAASAQAGAHGAVHAQRLAVDQERDSGATSYARPHDHLVVMLQQQVLQQCRHEGCDEPPVAQLQAAPPLIRAARCAHSNEAHDAGERDGPHEAQQVAQQLAHEGAGDVAVVEREQGGQEAQAWGAGRRRRLAL